MIFMVEKIQKTITRQMKKVQELEKKLRHLDDVYYHGADPLGITTTDEEYDALRAQYEELTGKKDKTIGATVKKTKRAIPLPFFMGSLDKIKEGEDTRFQRWKSADKVSFFILQPKLDGVSAMYCRPPLSHGEALYTRGDGSMGSDISFLLPHLQHLPSLRQGDAVRGEIVMPTDVFEQKYASSFKNNRNLVSGILNSKAPDPTLIRDLVLVPYEVLGCSGAVVRASPSQQMHSLQNEMKFREVIVGHAVPFHDLTMTTLHRLWDYFRKETPYPTDGIVIWKDAPYMPDKTGNPDYAVAFKKTKETVRTRVVQVHWSPSKYNVLKPRIEIEPVDLSGTRITFVTGFNAKYIMDHCLGKGAVVEVTRSGDVIPHILAVHRPADSGEPEMPLTVAYRWNDTEVDIIGTEKEEGGTADIKKIHFFFKTLGIKTLAEKTITKLVGACACDGKETTAPRLMVRLLKMSAEEMVSRAGLGPIESQNLWKQIHPEEGPREVPLALLMTASGIFGPGFGLRKIEPVVDRIPLGAEKMAEVPGWTRESASKFLQYMPAFEAFVRDGQGVLTIADRACTTPVTNNGGGGVVVFSGFRDKELERRLVERGYTVGNGVTATGTVCVLVRGDKETETVKTKKAREKGIPVQTVEEFCQLFSTC
jgi:NAD-dependent DNA ligase